jgi:hypothetical protein
MLNRHPHLKHITGLGAAHVDWACQDVHTIPMTCTHFHHEPLARPSHTVRMRPGVARHGRQHAGSHSISQTAAPASAAAAPAKHNGRSADASRPDGRVTSEARQTSAAAHGDIHLGLGPVVDVLHAGVAPHQLVVVISPVLRRHLDRDLVAAVRDRGRLQRGAAKTGKPGNHPEPQPESYFYASYLLEVCAAGRDSAPYEAAEVPERIPRMKSI